MARGLINSGDLKLLLAALDEKSSNPQDGYLCGKTYAAMATEFGERIKKPVSARQIRHYVDILKSTSAGSRIYTPPQGAPRGSRRDKGAQQSNIFGALGNELLALTGLSASALYSALYDSQDLAKNLSISMSKATFHNWLKNSAQGKPPAPIPTPRSHVIERDGFLKRCRLHIHGAHFELDPGRRYLLVLGGYEELTGHVDFRFFEAHVENTETEAVTDKKRGRPIKLEGPAEMTVISSIAGITLEISAERLATFISDMIAPLHVPVTRVQLRRSVIFSGGLDKLQMMLTGEESKQVSMTISMDDQPSHPYLPSRLPASIQPQEFSETLRAWVRQYNEKKAKSKVLKIRDDFNKELRRAQNIRNRFAKKHTREEQRLLDLKNFGLNITSAQQLITNPCKYEHVKAILNELSASSQAPDHECSD